MAEDKKYIQGLNEYIRQGEPQEQERGLSRSLDNDMERFFRNILLGETTTLRNGEMHLDWKPDAVFRQHIGIREVRRHFGIQSLMYRQYYKQNDRDCRCVSVVPVEINSI